MTRAWLIRGIALLLLFSPASAESPSGNKPPESAGRLRELVAKVGELYKAGRYADARPIAEEAVKVAEEALGPEAPDTATSLTWLGYVLYAMGDLDGAKSRFERALSIFEKISGPDHPNTATLLNNLAAVLQDKGDLKEARALYERAVAIREKSLGADDPDRAQSLNNLGLLLQAMGDAAGARPLLERALAIHEKALGPEDPNTAVSLNNLAAVLQDLGDLKGARERYERALAIHEKTLGPSHPDTATNLDNLASVLKEMGDLKGARGLVERALTIRESTEGPDHPDTAGSLSNLGGILLALGDPGAARPLYERALSICEKKLGTTHAETARMLNNLGRTRREMGDLEGAKALYERALAMNETVLGADHPETAIGLGNVAHLLMDLGDDRQAKSLFERALSIREKRLGPDHPETASSLADLAYLLRKMGDLPSAQALNRRAWKVSREALHLLLPSVSSRERCAMVAARKGQLAAYLAGLAGEPEEAYAAALEWRGAALRASAAAMKLPANASPETRKIAEDLAGARREFARLAMSPPRSKDGEPTVAERYDTARTRCEKLERNLADKMPGLAARAFLEVELSQVRKTLRPGEALLDVMENCGDFHAWVVRREGDVVYFSLGKTSELTPTVARFREAIEKDDEKAWKEAGAALREKIAKPLAAAIEGTKTLYVSPDGVLATIPWGLLPEGDGFLLERLPIVCVCGGGAGLVMASKAPRNEAAQGLLCVGDVDYEHAEGATGKGTRPDRQAEALPATKDEAEGVVKRFAEAHHGAPSHVLTGRTATVARFEKLATSARYIHVATHGYFDLEHLEVALGRATRGFAGEAISSPIAETASSRRESIGGWNPLLLSGMVFAGANAGDGGEGSDGLLTAEELQGLDLSGTELVVLSACETARGKLEAGEGVLGLSRALFVAGARGFMLSLWAVPDRDTQTLMDGFYEGLWARSQTPEQSLRAAQLSILARDREAKAFHPRAWGAWVVLR